MFLPHPRVKVSIVGSLRDREVACSASDRQGSNFESCVWRTVSSQSSHHPQEVLLAQFSLFVHKGGLKPDSFHFCYQRVYNYCYHHNFQIQITKKRVHRLFLKNRHLPKYIFEKNSGADTDFFYFSQGGGGGLMGLDLSPAHRKMEM